MTRKTRTARAVTLLAGVAVASVALSGPALAAPAHDDALRMSWDGQHYTATTSESFLGNAVIAPGRSNTRTVHIRNDGPSSGTLRASIVNVQIQDPDSPDVHHNPHHSNRASGAGDGAGGEGNFYDDLIVSWDEGNASFTDLDARAHTEILHVDLAQGEVVPLTLAYGLDSGVTSGNRANVEQRLASFDVLIEIGGDLPASPLSPDDPAPGAPPATSDDLPAAPILSPPGGLQATGVTGAGLLALAAIVLGAGLALRFARRDPQPGH